jgi:hypothetical protein
MTKQNEEPDKSNHEAKHFINWDRLPNNADYSRPETDTLIPADTALHSVLPASDTSSANESSETTNTNHEATSGNEAKQISTDTALLDSLPPTTDTLAEKKSPNTEYPMSGSHSPGGYIVPTPQQPPPQSPTTPQQSKTSLTTSSQPNTI